MPILAVKLIFEGGVTARINGELKILSIHHVSGKYIRFKLNPKFDFWTF